MHEEKPAEGQIEGRARRRLEGEEVGGDLLKVRAALGAEISQRFGAEYRVDLDAGDQALRSDTVCHQAHHRAWP